MSRTKAKVKKHAKNVAKKNAKKKAKLKRNKKFRNIQNNLGPEKWVLNVLLDGRWMEAKRFRKREQVDKHVEDTERRRKAGEIIIPGKVMNLETGEEVLSIKGSDMKGALPDKLANEESVDKTRPGLLKRLVGKK